MGGSVDTTYADWAKVASWEFNGEKKGRAHFIAQFASSRHHSGKTAHQAFTDDLRSSLMNGVPFAVGGRTASLTNPDVGMPSWKLNGHYAANQWMCTSANPDKKSLAASCPAGKPNVQSKFYSLYMGHDQKSAIDGGHFIAIVGYDEKNYYYLDTCARGTFANGPMKCRAGDPDDSYPNDLYHDTSIPHVWKIPQSDMWQLVSEWSAGGWIKYTGAASRTLATPW
jgi:hypothetical protein